jgi:hypothetical protein
MNEGQVRIPAVLILTSTDDALQVEVGSEMYATPESQEDVPLPLPVPLLSHSVPAPQRMPSVEPLEYELHGLLRWSRRLQGFRPYVYIGPARRSRWVPSSDASAHVHSSGPSDRFPVCHPSSAFDRLSIGQDALDQCSNGCGLAGSSIGRTRVGERPTESTAGLVDSGGIAERDHVREPARGQHSSGRSVVLCQRSSYEEPTRGLRSGSPSP